MQRIAIHSVPRSGSSWLGHILNSSPEVTYKYQPLFSYELKDYLSDNSSIETIDGFFNKLFFTNDEFTNQKKELASGKAPNFNKDKARFNSV
ncbi:MAG: hypothetical protein HC892_20510 [Saprospiraceae bacterium]|nr:hypothetical protein [Saprospiraceae bacterium]